MNDSVTKYIYHFIVFLGLFLFLSFFLLLRRVAAKANNKREKINIKAILLKLGFFDYSYASWDYYTIVDFFFAFSLFILAL